MINSLNEEYWRVLYTSTITGVTAWSTDSTRNMELVWMRVQGCRIVVLKGASSMVEMARQKVKDILARVCSSDLRSTTVSTRQRTSWTVPHRGARRAWPWCTWWCTRTSPFRA